MKDKVRRRFGCVFIIAGLLLVISSAVLLVYNLYTDRTAAKGIDNVLAQLSNGSEQTVQYGLYSSDMEMPIETVNGNDYIGRLSFPEYGLELPVLSEWSYPNLRLAPCRYSGSAYSDDMVIAGHNYSSFFGPLRNMRIGDRVVFTDVEGNAFEYEISDMQTLRPAAVEAMITGDWDLTLFTCTVGGRTRLALRCNRVSDNL